MEKLDAKCLFIMVAFATVENTVEEPFVNKPVWNTQLRWRVSEKLSKGL